MGKRFPRALVMPALDGISPYNWNLYTKTATGAHWRYEWNMNLIQSDANRSYVETPEPYESPGTSGGIFAMRRDWFVHLELFDEGLLEWGGDHFELTMKVWRCGGRIEIVPCSRIGHLFREEAFRPYPVSIRQVVANYKRLAHVWLKDHLEYWYLVKPEARAYQLHENIQTMHEQHDDLKCRNMSWYLENIDHEMLYEMDK